MYSRHKPAFSCMVTAFIFIILNSIIYFQDVCRISILIILRYLVEYLGGNSTISRTTCWMLITVVAFLTVIAAVFGVNMFRISLVVEMKIRNILGSMIFKKVRQI